jgi:hypothetical protein
MRHADDGAVVRKANRKNTTKRGPGPLLLPHPAALPPLPVPPPALVWVALEVAQPPRRGPATSLLSHLRCGSGPNWRRPYSDCELRRSQRHREQGSCEPPRRRRSASCEPPRRRRSASHRTRACPVSRRSLPCDLAGQKGGGDWAGGDLFTRWCRGHRQ